MIGNDIDRYLAHCEDVLLRNRHPISEVGSFPVHKSKPITSDSFREKSWTAFQSDSANDTISLYPVLASTANKALPLMPGEKLRSYAANDVTGTLPMAYETALNAAAESIGVDQVEVAEIVELYERRLEKVRRGPE